MSYRTPGTRLSWSTLNEWISCALKIAARRPSRSRYEAADAHWLALSDEVIKNAEQPELLSFTELINSIGNLAWHKPHRGFRGGTKWEQINVEARNRLTRLKQTEDRNSIGLWS